MRRFAFVAVLAACQGNSSDSQAFRLSLPEGGRVIQAPVAAGPRVETAACYAGRAPEELAGAVAAQLGPAWGDVRVLPRPGRWVILGERDGYGLAGVVAPRAACPEGEVWVSIGAHAAGAPGGTTAGPVGPRRQSRTRLPVVPTPE
jgi:hypothetical protein